MTNFDDFTLIARVLGDLPPQQQRAVDEAAAHDPELHAKLSALEWGLGPMPPPVSEPSSERAKPTVSRRQWLQQRWLQQRWLQQRWLQQRWLQQRWLQQRWLQQRWLQQLAASVAGVALLAGAAYAGYELLREKPLLEDNFRDEWLDSRIWDTGRGRKGVREESGHLRLLNRGSLVTAQEFTGPIEIELDWLWLDLASDPMYTDNLSIGLRTTGRHAPEHAFQQRDGVVLDFNSHRGAVYIYSADQAVKDEQISPRGELKFAAGKWYHLRIRDDGKRIEVFASGPEIDRKYSRAPAFTIEIAGEYAEHRVAFYNREYVGGANHESRIDNVVIRSWKAR